MPGAGTGEEGPHDLPQVSRRSRPGRVTARMPPWAWPGVGAGLRASFLGHFSGCLWPVTVNSPEFSAKGSRGRVSAFEGPAEV